MSKISKMSWIKILLVVAVVGTIVFLSFHWNVKLDPPGEIKPISQTEEIK